MVSHINAGRFSTQVFSEREDPEERKGVSQGFVAVQLL